MEAQPMKQEDQQILSEIVLNEKIIAHPTKGNIHFRTPTLETQQKVEALARAKKKLMRDAVDEVPDPTSPTGKKVVPAYKSKEYLEKVYRENGWWTDENELRLSTLMSDYTMAMAKLELLGFQSQEAIFNGISDAREIILKHLDEPSAEVLSALTRLCLVGKEVSLADKTIVKDAATSTAVDDELAIIDNLQMQFTSYLSLGKIYADLMALESERNALFSESWQEQLNYYIRLAQLYYCTEKEDRSPLWNTIDELEKESDVDFVKWLFSELQAFWQGLSDDARERLKKYSFTPRLSAEKSSSDESPAQAPSSTDGDSPEKTQVDSSVVTDTPAQ